MKYYVSMTNTRYSTAWIEAKDEKEALEKAEIDDSIDWGEWETIGYYYQVEDEEEEE